MDSFTVPQDVKQSWFIFRDVFLLTVHSEEFPCCSQLREISSYWKNWDLLGTTLRAAARNKEMMENSDFYLEWTSTDKRWTNVSPSSCFYCFLISRWMLFWIISDLIVGALLNYLLEFFLHLWKPVSALCLCATARQSRKGDIKKKKNVDKFCSCTKRDQSFTSIKVSVKPQQEDAD